MNTRYIKKAETANIYISASSLLITGYKVYHMWLSNRSVYTQGVPFVTLILITSKRFA